MTASPTPFFAKPANKSDGERITGVALLTSDGRLFALPRPNRHFNLFAIAAFQGLDSEPCTQGFVTNAGRFVDRKEAAVIGKAAGQYDEWPVRVELYSEDLW